VISKSLIERTEKYAVLGHEPLETFKLALEEEQNLLQELVSGQTERSQQVKEVLCKRVYLAHVAKA
jgi:hypothetical protein